MAYPLYDEMFSYRVDENEYAAIADLIKSPSATEPPCVLLPKDTPSADETGVDPIRVPVSIMETVESVPADSILKDEKLHELQ